MKIITCFLLCCLAAGWLRAQTINRAMLAKYSQRAEQQKVIDRQVVLLKLSAQQATAFKTVSFFYIDKALAIVNANINGSSFTLYRKLRPLKSEHEDAMKKLLTEDQLEAWNKERKEHGIVAQLIQ